MPSSAKLRQLHALSGVVPLAAFLIWHIAINATALRGQNAFVRATSFDRFAVVGILEVLVVWLPLAFHAVYGFVLWRTPRPDMDRFPGQTGWVHGAQRISGLVLFVFVSAHLWELRVRRATGLPHEDLYTTMMMHLSSTWHGLPMFAIAYLLGVTAAAFHVAAGGWTYLVGRGTIPSERITRAGWAFALAGLVLFLLGSSTVISLATGMHFGDEPPPKASSECKPP